ncbi:hypothetical protein GW17_00035648 [Ensete ventricosum]|nr:hypothetical protein GW17_00035648 [Ensete ventricosum]
MTDRDRSFPDSAGRADKHIGCSGGVDRNGNPPLCLLLLEVEFKPTARDLERMIPRKEIKFFPAQSSRCRGVVVIGMGKRRVAYVSDDEDEDPMRRNDADSDRYGDGDRKYKWRKKLRVDEEDVEEGEIVSESQKGGDGGDGGRGGGEEEARVEEPEEDEEEVAMEPQGDAKPIGDVVRVSGNGRSKKIHYSSFEFSGNFFELVRDSKPEDPVLLTPEDYKTKPYVAIIKDIAQDVDGKVWVTGQWFYRPEVAVKKGVGHWKARDHRELFYSFHLDEVPAESVMHKCVVHFVPWNKKWPVRQQFPGFVVQNVYDTVEKKLWKLTTKGYEGTKQHEIDLLVKKTRECLGELSDAELEETSASAPVLLDHSDQSANRQLSRRKDMDPVDFSRFDDATKTENQIRAETPGSCTSPNSDCKTILAKCKALTGNSHRDKWLDKLLQGIKEAYFSKKNSVLAVMNGNGESGTTMGSNTNSSDVSVISFCQSYSTKTVRLNFFINSWICYASFV